MFQPQPHRPPASLASPANLSYPITMRLFHSAIGSTSVSPLQASHPGQPSSPAPPAPRPLPNAPTPAAPFLSSRCSQHQRAAPAAAYFSYVTQGEVCVFFLKDFRPEFPGPFLFRSRPATRPRLRCPCVCRGCSSRWCGSGPARKRKDPVKVGEGGVEGGGGRGAVRYVSAKLLWSSRICSLSIAWTCCM